MKPLLKILSVFVVFAIAALLFAAAPPPGTYIVPSFFTTNAAKIYGTNGVGVSSNAVTGIYLIDGRDLTNGFVGGTNAVIQTNGVNVGQVGTINFVDANNTTVTGVLAGAVAKIGVSASGGSSPAGISVQTNAFGGTVGSASNLLFGVSSNLVVHGTNTVAGGRTNSIFFDTIQPIATNSSPSFLSMQIYDTLDAINSITVNAPGGTDVLLQNGGDSTFRFGVNWNNGASTLKDDGRIFLGVLHTPSRLLRLNPSGITTNSVYDDDDIAKRQIGDAELTNIANLANSPGLLKNDGSGGFSYDARPLVDPFVVIDNVAYYPTNPWNQKLSEEWNGDVTTTTVGAMGNNSWSIASSGNTIFRVAQLAESTADGYLSIVLTNAGTATSYLIGNASTPSYLLATNKSLIWLSRIRIGLTNVTGQIQKMIVGLGSNVTFNEPTDGIYITVNTNLNTNSLVAVTARASSRTFTYSQHASNTFNQFEWITVGARLDSTGTNAIFFCGPSRTNLTSFATNNANIPNTVLVGPLLTVHRITGTGGATRLTNYCDNFFLWQLPATANF